jgi:hypothetical protein
MSDSDLQYRAALGLCVAAMKRMRLRVAVWEEQDAKALDEGMRILEAPTARSAPASSEGPTPPPVFLPTPNLETP